MTRKVKMYPERQDDYLAFYRAFHVFNRICWNGTLPKTMIRFYRKNSSILAFASPSGIRRNFGLVPPQISFNMFWAQQANDQDFFEVLVHEMVHIWQFAHGSFGGHGTDFKAEMIRCGLVKGRMIPEDSPFAFAWNIIRLRRVDYTKLLCRVAENGYNFENDYNFFMNHQNQLYL